MALTIGGGPQISSFMSGVGAGSRSWSTAQPLCSDKQVANHRATNLDHLWCHEANAGGPSFWRIVQDVIDGEVRVFLGELVKVFLEKDIFWGDIGKDEVDTGLIIAAVAWSPSDDGPDDLQHRCDSSSASDHAQMRDHVGRIDHGPLRTLHPDRLPNLQGRHISGDVAGRVALE